MKVKNILFGPKKINIKRIMKFSATGLFCTFIDFFFLNILSVMTGFAVGMGGAVIGVISFLIANVISYKMNKNWTFRGNGKSIKYGRFLEFSILGAMANFILVYFLTLFLDRGSFSELILLNISKLIATIAVALMNYHNYKNYVFNNSLINEQTV